MEALTFAETRTIWAILAATVISIGYAILLRYQIGAKNTGTETETLYEKGHVITQGILAYRQRHLAPMGIVIVLVAALLGSSAYIVPISDAAIESFGDAATLWLAVGRAGACVAGALIAYAASALGLQATAAGTIGVAVAAQKGYARALQAAYRSGMVSGLLTIGAGVLGATILFLLFRNLAPEMLLCFALGGALVALCNRMGGNIYTKATSIGTLLTNVSATSAQEQGIHDVAKVSHVVSTHISHCAGTLTDVLQSFAGVLVAALFLGLMLAYWAIDATPYGSYMIGYALYPLVVAGIGVLAALIGNTIVRTTDERRNAMAAINRGFHVSVALCIVGFAAATPFVLMHPESGATDWQPFFAVLTGSLLSVVLERIGTTLSKVYFNPYKQVNRSSLLANLAMGREASAWGIVTIIVALIVAFLLYGSEPIALCYSVALTGLGMLTLTGNTVSIDSFRPIARTASALGTMSALDKNARNTLEDLDFAGSMTSATTRGVTIGASVLGSIALAGAVVVAAYDGIPPITTLMPMGIVGLVFGGAVSVLFLVLIAQAVSGTAVQVVHASDASSAASEASTDSDTEATSVSVVTPSLHIMLFGIATIALLAPVAIGYVIGHHALIGYLVGSIVFSQLIVVLTANSEQAKRRVRNAMQDEATGVATEKTAPSRATERQKTERELLTDLSGPSLHTLILMTHLVALLVVILGK